MSETGNASVCRSSHHFCLIFMRSLLITLALATSSATVHAPDNRRPLAGRRVVAPSVKGHELIAAKKLDDKPPGFLSSAYKACGLATASAWTTVVLTTIRSNQPAGALMPSWQHPVFARASVLSAVPLIFSCYATLASASKDSWEQLSSPTFQRLNTALFVAGVGSALWVGFAPILTQIPGSNPLACHQSYTGLTRAALIGAYGSAAILSGAVWARTLPEEVRKCPLAWPGHMADGIAKTLVSLAPASKDDPVNVKYALLSTGFLGLAALGFGSFPLAVVPSWTGRRTSRAFPAWLLLAAVSSYNLKEARESGKAFAESTYRTLSSGLTSFGAIYLSAKVGAICFDPSFPVHYGIVKMVPGAQLAAATLIGLTLRPDKA